MKACKTIVHVKSICTGNKNLADILFELAKGRMRFMEKAAPVCYTDGNGSENQYQDCAFS
ncbi:hypothetical protein AZF37_00600 [endosymbiont 'TC1' of Trimyema compressum]|nr:hypothetical protein AZF37_00600 [endosymbiont 'TC1' of Trimyema compressum]